MTWSSFRSSIALALQQGKCLTILPYMSSLNMISHLPEFSVSIKTQNQGIPKPCNMRSLYEVIHDSQRTFLREQFRIVQTLMANLKCGSTCSTARTGHDSVWKTLNTRFSHFENYHYLVLEEKQDLFCLFACFFVLSNPKIFLNF